MKDNASIYFSLFVLFASWRSLVNLSSLLFSKVFFNKLYFPLARAQGFRHLQHSFVWIFFIKIVSIQLYLILHLLGGGGGGGGLQHLNNSNDPTQPSIKRSLSYSTFSQNPSNAL